MYITVDGTLVTLLTQLEQETYVEKEELIESLRLLQQRAYWSHRPVLHDMLEDACLRLEYTDDCLDMREVAHMMIMGILLDERIIHEYDNFLTAAQQEAGPLQVVDSERYPMAFNDHRIRLPQFVEAMASTHAAIMASVYLCVVIPMACMLSVHMLIASMPKEKDDYQLICDAMYEGTAVVEHNARFYALRNVRRGEGLECRHSVFPISIRSGCLPTQLAPGGRTRVHPLCPTVKVLE